MYSEICMVFLCIVVWTLWIPFGSKCRSWEPAYLPWVLGPGRLTEVVNPRAVGLCFVGSSVDLKVFRCGCSVLGSKVGLWLVDIENDRNSRYHAYWWRPNVLIHIQSQVVRTASLWTRTRSWNRCWTTRSSILRHGWLLIKLSRKIWRNQETYHIEIFTIIDV